MKKFLCMFFIQFNFLLMILVPIIILLQIIIYPLWETVWCGKSECYTRESHIIYSRAEFRDVQVKDKQSLGIYTVRENILPINQYFLRTNDGRQIFSMGYFSRKNAERDVNIIKNSNSVTITKKNMGLLTTLCICLYIILQSLGIIINKISKKNQLRENDTRQN